MNDKDILTQIIEWANSDNSIYKNATEYQRGFKSGVMYAKDTIKEIINSEQ